MKKKFISPLFLLIFLFSITLNAAPLSNSSATVIWEDHRPLIETPRLILRPIEPNDLPTYIELFGNSVAMSLYVDGPRSEEYTRERFNNWLERWNEHTFSALAIVEKRSGALIGHAVLGHGAYEGEITQGTSEIAYILFPEYWNESFKDEEKLIGIKGFKGLGTEVIDSLISYAKSLAQNDILVPCGVSRKNREEAENLLMMGLIKDGFRSSDGKLIAVYLPFTHVVATCSKENFGSYSILEKLFVKKYHGKKSPYSNERDLFKLDLTNYSK